MIDIKLLRNDFENITKKISTRNKNYNLDEFLEIDKKRREILSNIESLRAEQNSIGKNIPKMKQSREDTSDIMAEMKELSDEIKELEVEFKKFDTKIENILLSIPNIPHESVPVSENEDDKIILRNIYEPRNFDFEPLPHWDLGVNLGILDFERAAKVAGSRFVFYKGIGARLERALINLMLDMNIEAGYTELLPPYIANYNSMQGTGQLPKFKEDMFELNEFEYFLIPTSEVAVTNYHKNEILDGSKLPINYTAYSACFRAEAGAAGRDSRGLIRQHQFNKVELVKFARPEDSYSELEKLTNTAEEILKKLELPYRVASLVTSDLGFSSAKTYDIEIWMPSYNKYVEISSCSNFEDFQARRANIKFRDTAGEKLRFVHTLNGSGLAVGRTFAAILENYQNLDGSVSIPKALQPYMGGVDIIGNK